jgi:hypothetical protein
VPNVLPGKREKKKKPAELSCITHSTQHSVFLKPAAQAVLGTAGIFFVHATEPAGGTSRFRDGVVPARTPRSFPQPLEK